MKTQQNSSSKQQTIKVAVRIRPCLADEVQRGLAQERDKLKVEGTSSVRIANKQNSVKSYAFDQVFDESSTQESIFKRTRTDYLIEQVLTGFHATIFVYGQTGSGKTYTMEGYKYAKSQKDVLLPQFNRKTAALKIDQAQPSPGSPEDGTGVQTSIKEEGIIPRAIRELFAQIERKRAETSGKSRISVKVQYIQLYNEKVYDLLNSNSQKLATKKTMQHGLKLKMNALTDEVLIENVFIFECAGIEDAFKYFWKGLKNKVMSSHNMNQSSSRSHCILTFVVHQEDLSRSDAQGNIISKLQLVDLAGSERQSHTTSADQVQDPIQFKEAIQINKSLFTLRQVITALTENNSQSNRRAASNAVGKGTVQNLNYVPYRESKLTTILKQSLGGNSFTLMIACLAPIDCYTEENISTLNYAARAARISNAPSINMDPKLKEIMEQRRTIERLKQELKRANDQIKFLTMGGCVCKLEVNQVALPGTIKEVQGDGGKQIPASGFTINNNYSNNTISIIDGTANLNTSSQGQGTNSNQLVGQGLVANQSELKELSSASFVSPQIGSMSQSESNAIQNRDMQAKERSSMQLPQLPPQHLNNTSESGRNMLLDQANNAYPAAGDLPDQHHSARAPHANMSMHLVTPGQSDGVHVNRSMEAGGRKINFSITQSQFNAMQDQVRNKLGMTMPMLGNHAGVGMGPGYNQDRLITSISIIKEVLISNMQLREDLLMVSQEHENTMQTNFQLMVENEDLRDQIALLDQTEGASIDYLPYLMPKSLEKTVEKAQTQEDLQQTKNMILTHVFSLRKDNRQLQRRIKNFEDKYQERRAQRQRIQSRAQHSRHNSNLTDQSHKNFDTENSIDLYPELGPNTPLIKLQESEMRNKKAAARYGTSKDISVSKKRGQLANKPAEVHNNYLREQITDPKKGSQYAPDIRASSLNQDKKKVIKLFNHQEATDPQTSRVVHVPPLAKNQNNKVVKMNMHRKLVAIENQRQTPDMTASRPLVSTSQNFYQLPQHENSTFGGPISPLNASEAVPLGGGQAKQMARKAETSMFVNQSRQAYQNKEVFSEDALNLASHDEDDKKTTKKKKKTKMVFNLPEVQKASGQHQNLQQSQQSLKPQVPLHSSSMMQSKNVHQSMEISSRQQSLNHSQLQSKAPSTHRPKSRNANNNNQTAVSTSIPIKTQAQNLKNSSRPKRKLVHASEQPGRKVISMVNNGSDSSAIFTKQRSSNPSTTPDLKRKKQMPKGESVAASTTNMSIINRLQQTMIREPNVKKQLRKSQEVVDQSTAKKSKNAYYEDIIYQGRGSLPVSTRVEPAKRELGSRNASQSRQAVIEYIRKQEARLADDSNGNSASH